MSALLVLAEKVFHLCSEQSLPPKLKVKVTKYSLGVSMVCDLRVSDLMICDLWSEIT